MRNRFSSDKLNALRMEGLININELARRAQASEGKLRHYLPRRVGHTELAKNAVFQHKIKQVLREHVDFVDSIIEDGQKRMIESRRRALKDWGMFHWKRVRAEWKDLKKPPQVLAEHVVFVRVLLGDIPAIPAEIEPNIRGRMSRWTKQKMRWMRPADPESKAEVF